MRHPLFDPGSAIRCHHVDVFTDRPMAGNGLTVVEADASLDGSEMLDITRELRQFETIFLLDVDDHGATARVFTPEEELVFAGHPVLGAAAVLHWIHQKGSADSAWELALGGRDIEVRTVGGPQGTVHADMNQGRAILGPALDAAFASDFAAALGLADSDLSRELPAQVVSTGLPYLIFPVTAPGLARSQMARATDLNAMLADVGAEFLYVVDPDAPEGRTWDRSGLTEDVATGSAAGPAVAYLFEHGLRARDAVVEMNQGRFVGRPSAISVREAANGDLWVGGEVAAFASGLIRR